MGLAFLKRRSEWNLPLSQPLIEALGKGAPTELLNLRCVAAHGVDQPEFLYHGE